MIRAEGGTATQPHTQNTDATNGEKASAMQISR